MLLVLFLLAEYSHKKPEIYLKQNKYTDFSLSAFEQKLIEELLKKNVFKVVIFNKLSHLKRSQVIQKALTFVFLMT